MKKQLTAFAVLVMCLSALVAMRAAPAAPADSIVVASTTSTQDSGLFEYLLPIVKDKTGLTVKVVALGTGQALDTGRRGDADVVFVHAKAAELQFVAEGQSLKRYPVMYNDFVLIGPQTDPAVVKGLTDVGRALVAIKTKHAPFISRGDRSGTHMAELELWQTVGIDIDKDRGPWYRSIGQGMGAALNMAASSSAYVLCDRATWIHFKNKGDLRILVEGDARLRNQYGVMLINPAKHPTVNAAGGQKFIDYLVSPNGQADIAHYRVNGQQLFFPNANAAE